MLYQMAIVLQYIVRPCPRGFSQLNIESPTVYCFSSKNFEGN